MAEELAQASSYLLEEVALAAEVLDWSCTYC